MPTLITSRYINDYLYELKTIEPSKVYEAQVTFRNYRIWGKIKEVHSIKFLGQGWNMFFIGWIKCLMTPIGIG